MELFLDLGVAVDSLGEEGPVAFDASHPLWGSPRGPPLREEKKSKGKKITQKITPTPTPNMIASFFELFSGLVYNWLLPQAGVASKKYLFISNTHAFSVNFSINTNYRIRNCTFS